MGGGFWRGSLSIRDKRSEPQWRHSPLDASNERSSPERTYFLDDDHPRDECGIFGIYDRDSDVARATFFGLHALQHRGQESAGIAASDGQNIRVHADLGLVTQVFREEDLQGLTGHMAIGHNRYSTKGAPRRYNAQPYIINGPDIEFAFGHNGNVINAGELRREMAEWGVKFRTSSDSEVIANLYANAPGRTWEERSAYCMRRLKGAYSLVMMTAGEVIGVRDPLGIRPLCIGNINNGYVLASESCALDNLGATFERELEPGETVVIDETGVRSSIWSGTKENGHSMCVFEHIYISRPDSILAGRLAHVARQDMGRELAKLHPVDADLVIGVPDSGISHATGYSEESGIPYGEGLVKNRYVNRTFIEPDQSLRDLGVRLKFNPLRDVIDGKRVIVVDDSIVRGTTTPRIVSMLRKAGATEVHVRISAPPIIATCHFGVDMSTLDQLIAANKSVDEICEFIDADSLGFLDVEHLMMAVGVNDNSYCRGCFTGRYPIPVQLEMSKMELDEPASVEAD